MPALSRAVVVLAWLVPAGVMVQAVLAGQATFGTPSLFGLHGGVGHGVLLLSVVLAVLAWVARVPRLAAVLASLSVVALVGQTGMGYTGRRAGIAEASAVHIPMGVAILGLTVAVAVLVSLRSQPDGSPDAGRA